MARIADPLIELLAIKLHEHAQADVWPAMATRSWTRLREQDREIYRRIARGEADLPSGDRAS